MKAMRCKRHPYEGGAGVCASCLRDRLLALAAAQNQASSLPPPSPEPSPAPPLFPRSVSPYVCPRKSDASGPWRQPPSSRLFFRTPQVEPTYGGGAGFEEGDIGFQIRRRRSSRLSALAALFGHHHHHQNGSEEKGGERKHGSWFAGIMPRGRRKKEPAVSATSPLSPRRRRSSQVVSNRGLSPVRPSCDGSEESSSVADSPWRPSPMRKPPCRRPLGGGAGAGVSGFSVCISPLVRPTTGRHHRGGHPPDAPALSGELHQPSSGSSLHHCRSWKLADGGRFR